MGLLLRRLMYKRWRRHWRWHRCKLQARNGSVPDGSINSEDKHYGSPFQQDDITQIGEIKEYPWTYIPEEIVCHIHSLMPLHDAARARNGSVADGSITSQDKHYVSPCQQDYTTKIGEIKGYSWTYIPEEIMCHIHSLMPLRDAARAACVRRAFRRSWKSFPNLTFSNQTLGLNENARGEDEIARDFASKVDHIMKNHLGTGVKTFKLLGAPNYSARYHRCVDSWLEKAITPGIEELALKLAEHFVKKKYRFPCPILSCGNGDSIRHLYLNKCAFRPTVGFGPLRSLAKLKMFSVYIKGDELQCLLSSSLVLESLDIDYCCEIVYMKIPCLQRLTHLSVAACFKLRGIESKAPNLSSFRFDTIHQVQVSLGKALQVRKLYIDCSKPVCHSRAELASSMENLEAGIHPSNEMVNTPLVSNKFLHLECLSVAFNELTISQSFDYLSTVPSSLETFISDVSQRLLEHPFYKEISYFPRAKTRVYLTCHMLRAWLS